MVRRRRRRRRCRSRRRGRGCSDFFDEEPDGYLRFRRSLLRDAAYEGLPYKLRRKLHGVVAARIEEEMDYPEEAAGILSLHYFEAGDYRSRVALRAVAAARRAGASMRTLRPRGSTRARWKRDGRLADLEQGRARGRAEALGDAWYRAGEFRKASDAFTAARRSARERSARRIRAAAQALATRGEARQLPRRRCAGSTQAREALQGLDGHETLRARPHARPPGTRPCCKREGRTNEALAGPSARWPRPRPPTTPRRSAMRYFVMGWAYGELGQGGRAAADGSVRWKRTSARATCVRQAGVLMSLGVVCQWEGRWDEALSYYEQGRDESLKIGDTVGAALARINVAEILTDRGEWAEAEALLLETLPLWKASQYRYYLAACLSLLGRVSLRRGPPDEALARLEDAKANFLHVGAEQEVPAVDARIAECRVALGDTDAALEIVNASARARRLVDWRDAQSCRC